MRRAIGILIAAAVAILVPLPGAFAPNFAPKPPPRYSVMTWTFSFLRPNMSAISLRAEKMDCVEAQTVMCSSSSQRTTRPWVSRALCVWHCVW